MKNRIVSCMFKSPIFCMSSSSHRNKCLVSQKEVYEVLDRDGEEFNLSLFQTEMNSDFTKKSCIFKIFIWF